MNITTVAKGPSNKARGNAYAEESGVEGVSGPISVAKKLEDCGERTSCGAGLSCPLQDVDKWPCPSTEGSWPFYRGSTSSRNLDHAFEFVFVSYRSKVITVRLLSSLQLVKE